MRSFIFLIYGCLIIGLFGCSNSSHFTKRKYLPNFKVQQELKATTIVVNEPIDSISKKNSFITLHNEKNNTVSNYPSRTSDKTVVIKKIKKPTVTKKYPEYATLNLSDNLLITDTVKTEEYYQSNYKSDTDILNKIVRIAVIVYIPFVTPLIIKSIEGKTARHHHSKIALLILLIAGVLFLFAIMFGLLAALFYGLAGNSFNFNNYINTITVIFVVIALMYYIITLYLGIKAVVVN